MWYPPYKKEGQPYRAEPHINFHLLEPLDICLHLTTEEQAEFRTLQEQRQKTPEASPSLSTDAVQQKSDLTLGQALHVVSYLMDTKYDDYDLWIKVGMGLHHQFNGHLSAFKIWDAWSCQFPKYNAAQDLLISWKHFADKKESVTMGTLIRMAKEKGYDPARTKESKVSHLVNFNLRKFLAQQIPPIELILNPIIPEQGLIMLYAPRGIGKTYLSLSIAYIVAAGKSMFDGKWRAEKAHKVLFVDGEMPAARLQERMAHLVVSAGELANDDFFNIITPDFQERGIPDLSKVEGQKLIEEHLEGVKLLILDNLSSLFRSGSENEAESWKVAQEWLLDLRRRGISVLLVHHANKNGTQRGTSKKEDLLDTIISLKRPEDYDPEEGARFEIHYEKARGFYGEDAKPFEVQLQESNGRYIWIVKELEDLELQEIIGLHQQGMGHRKIAQELGINRGKVHRILMSLKQKGKISHV
jgi:KaiC/GvpD/RAD55 family RecA-like ATPase